MKTWIINGQKGIGRVSLMTAETDCDFFSLGIRRGRRITESLALIYIASYLEDSGWKFEPAIETSSESYISESCRNAVVGISSQINNYGNALRLAATAKNSGARLVILGGPHPTNRAHQIVLNQPNIDVVVRGQGEVAFQNILECKSLVSSVVEETHLPLSSLPPRKRILWSGLWETEPQEATLFGKQWSLTNWSEGCSQAVCGKPCIFCSISHAKCSSRRTIAQIIEELWELKLLGIGAIEVGDDDFPGVISEIQLSDLYNEMNACNLSFDLFIHARAASIASAKHLEKLRKIGVRILQVGFESGDPTMKAIAGDKATLEQENRLINWCIHSGTKFQATMMVGMPGENEISMWKTLDRAKELASKKVLWSLMMDPLIPLPGSQAFNMLCKQYPEFQIEDHVYPEKYIRAWFKEFTKVDLQKFLDLRQQLFSELTLEANAGMLLK